MHKQDVVSPQLLRIKLLECLHLLSMEDESIVNMIMRSITNDASPKRNISRLLENSDTLRLSVNDLAHLSGRSVSSFNRDFKALYKMPPKKWLKDKRLSQAHYLLSEKNLSVTDAAVELGYENVSHFIKQFKEKYKITPKQLKHSV